MWISGREVKRFSSTEIGNYVRLTRKSIDVISTQGVFFYFVQSSKYNVYVTYVQLFAWSVANMWRLLHFKRYGIIVYFLYVI